ncbi:hypothetical protein [Sphingomonas sp. M1-B02]|uniref:hypothetical protein n=1 Tax=Sphingomonas sp. M1-B02 TaxID=3114300 RepID=UPI00223FA7F8|nr:hypothetical protein [Sphingomonas sp. S6-11]UZK64645.1 hypothetical protein OKW87_08775 [Sphingomonas sp. S6-11]
MWAFTKSVLLGTLAAAALPSIFTVTLAIDSLPEGLDGGGRLFPSLWLAILPIVVTIPIVLGTSVLFGLALTVLLKRTEHETAAAYMISGAVLGFAVPLVILLIIGAPEGHWVALLGALSGAVTAHTWWRSAREPNGS